MVKSYADYLRQHYNNKRIIFIPHGSIVDNCNSIVPEEKVILMFGYMGPFKGLKLCGASMKK